MGLRVAVIGAGMGGLVLAQALARAGDDVLVVERDPAPEATGGYRLHLEHRACAALRRHLPPAVYQAVLASSAAPSAFRRLAVTDHRLRLLAAVPNEPDRNQLLIGRRQLRQLLCTGLGDRLRFGQTFDRFQVRDDGSVQVHLGEGPAFPTDLLVGADGVGSRVAGALAGRATSSRVGLSGIAGRTAIEDPAVVPEVLRTGPVLGLGVGGIGLFLTYHDPTANPAVDPRSCHEVPALLEPPTLIWGVIAVDRRLPDGLRDLGPTELIETAGAVLTGWQGAVRALVAAADPTSVSAYAFHAADPDAPLMPWPAGPVTALGDAVHAMPPTGGQSAATAIRDADRLARRLSGVRAGRVTLPVAVRDFQADMATYAPAAVRESLQPVRWINRMAGPVATGAARVGLPVATTLAGGVRAATRLIHRGGRPSGRHPAAEVDA